MKKDEIIQKSYEIAKERYEAVEVSVDKTIEVLEKLSLSIHCWQADDVTGFENFGNINDAGIQATGNYPGKARNMDELRQDIEKVLALVGGKHRLNLHAIYGDFQRKKIDRNEIEPSHFTSWMQWAQEKGKNLILIRHLLDIQKVVTLHWQIPTKKFAIFGLNTPNVVD